MIIPPWFGSAWAERHWTPWESFGTDRLQHVPAGPGFYRIRSLNSDDLVYLGETGLNLRDRLNALRRNTMLAEMPFNDPHTAAPGLWAFRTAGAHEFELSTSGFSGGKAARRALECMLLWTYRLQSGKSTWLNHGRFHPEFSKSRNASTRVRGARLPTLNAAAGPCASPLPLQGVALDGNWMGLAWSSWEPLSTANPPASNGVYRVALDGGQELEYIGQSNSLKSRLRTHSQAAWGANPIVSYCELPERQQPHQLLEVENDLIGAYFHQMARPPRRQFGASDPEAAQ